MPDTPTNPMAPIPSSRTVGPVVMGTEPLPFIVDPDHSGVPIWNRRPVRDAVASTAFKLVAFLFPKSPWAQVLTQLQPQIQAFIDKGAQ